MKTKRERTTAQCAKEAGLLKFRRAQMQSLADDYFIGRMVVFFQKEGGERTASMTDEALRTLAKRALATGRAIGIVTERELVRWGLLGLLTEGAAYDDERICGPLRALGTANQAKVATLLDLVAQEIAARSKL